MTCPSSPTRRTTSEEWQVRELFPVAGSTMKFFGGSPPRERATESCRLSGINRIALLLEGYSLFPGP